MPAASTPSAHSKRTRTRWIFRGIGAFLVLCPWLWTNLADVVRRDAFLRKFDDEHRLFFAASLGVSLVFWSLLIVAASRHRRGFLRHVFGVIFVVLFGLSAGVQAAFFSIWHTYDCAEADVYTRSFLWPLIGSLPLGRPTVWLHLLLPLLLGGMLLRLARRYVRPRRRIWLAACTLALGALGAIPFVKSSYRPIQASTSDVLYFHAVVASYQEQLHLTDFAYQTRPQHRHPLSVPALTREPTPPRNVLLVLQESQRFDVTCNQYDPDCQLATRASNRAVPGRLPLMHWHALGSSTTLSCSAIWTGLLPSDPQRDLETAPTVFRYAKAAGFSTLYFTSQHFAAFQNMKLQFQDEPIDQLIVASHLSMKADWDTGAKDSALSDYVIKHWDKLPEPFFAIVHYSNQHQPYVVDEDQSPFAQDPSQPEDSIKNRLAYNENVVYLSDLAVGRLLEKIKHSDVGQRTVVLYTSDHGEGMGEHGWSGHTVTHYETEIRVPAWIDAPPGTLTDRERASLNEHEHAWHTHVDLAPTFLDLMGAWNAPELAPFRAKMVGLPLTRPVEPPKPIPMTNDSWIWESSYRSWGYIQGNMKTFSLDGRKKLLCFDLDADPEEKHDLGEAACGALGPLTHALFPSQTTATKPYHPLR